MRAALSAPQFESLGLSLSSRRALIRVTMAALSFTILIAASYQAPAQARPQAGAPAAPESLLPQTVGVALVSDAGITIDFDEPMDPASVEESLQIVPAQRVDLQWDRSRTALTVVPASRWRADERYLVVVDGAAQTDSGDLLPASRRFTFTTEAAPQVVEFQVHLAGQGHEAKDGGADVATTRAAVLEADRSAGGLDTALALPIGKGATSEVPDDTATDVSASSSISIGFSHAMDLADVEAHFRISPEVAGNVSWSGESLVFTPSERLDAGMRYTISLAGAHDAAGNLLGDTSTFSFVVQDGAQITKTTPERGADDAGTAYVQMWFSQPMKVDETNAAFTLVDTVTGQPVGGHLTWNEASTQLWYTPDRPLAGGRTFRVVLADGARDDFGNAVTAEWEFTTGATAVASAPSVRSSTSTRSVAPPAAGPATSLAGYALNQVNAARAAYGFAPVVLDPAVSAVAASHAWDQARNGYFSHTGADGSSRQTRLARGGVGFGWSGENQCYHIGMSEQATLNWCHAQFMGEPYPGHWNHIGNILNPNARRLGVGIATVGGRTIITWDFTD